MASLVFMVFFYYRIDDIEDGSELRRGHPVAHAIFGIPQTINAANYVYFIALERTLALNHPKVSLNVEYKVNFEQIIKFISGRCSIY